MLYELLIFLVEWFLILSVVWIIFTYLFRHRNYFGAVSSRWHHSFPEQEFSTKEIYAAVTSAVYARQIPGVTIGKANHFQAGYLQGKREYLKVQRDNLMFLICAAPFGKD